MTWNAELLGIGWLYTPSVLCMKLEVMLTKVLEVVVNRSGLLSIACQSCALRETPMADGLVWLKGSVTQEPATGVREEPWATSEVFWRVRAWTAQEEAFMELLKKKAICLAAVFTPNTTTWGGC